ncbi:MAG TPA: GDSL-type esterase/lipase family protein [Vicinamibacterales bacterium]|nr:GDSL-type esterase/lipase family protein [Vicinamibacterales bacterium]
MIRTRLRKFLLIALPAAVFALIAGAIAIEVWVRLAWDPARGRPGFFVSDAVLGQRLAPNYDGWFAGVPARINSLGFRDHREYSLAKPPGTFRILVLGDSVTFGHGALYETTYPYLLEQQLRAWRPDVKWEVWNLGVPGYNTAQELAYLQLVEERYAPDLVVVGFFPNDFTGFEPNPSPGVVRRAMSAVLRSMQRHLYSTEFYKRVILTVRYRLMSSGADRQRLEHLESEDALLNSANAADANEQKLGTPHRFTDEEVKSFACEGIGPSGESGIAKDLRERPPHLAPWFNAVEGFQRLHREGRHRVVFFVNMAPFVCRGGDRFIDHATVADSDAVMAVLGNGTPAVSSLPEFLHYRPSEMPAAAGHSLGNSNLVKANVLFAYLRDRVLQPLLPAVPAR